MATNVFQVNIYQINQNQSFDAKAFAFPATGVIVREAEGVQFAPNGTTRLYGIVQPVANGLNVSQPQFYTVETVSQLVSKINA